MIEDKAPLVLALDLGGTKIKAAIISDKWQMVAREYCDTMADEGQEAVINRIFSAMEHVLSAGGVALSQLSGISLAIAGAMDTKKGLVTSSPNLPGWHNVPLQSMVGEKYGVPTFLIHDANAAALGENRLGAGRGVKNLVFLTVSTGIGGGIITEGKLYSGASGAAGEIGHMTIDVNGPRCTCGNTGCLEMLASGKAVAREAIRRVSNGEQSSLSGMVAGNLRDITAEKVSLAAQAGDPLAGEVIFQAANYLGIGLVNLVNIFNPEMIIIGGGLSKMGERLLYPARWVVKERAFAISAQAVKIVVAQLGDDAGMLGAAIFALEQKKHQRQ